MTEKSKTITIDIGQAVEQLQANPELATAIMQLVEGPALAEAYEELGRVTAMYQSQVDLNLAMVEAVKGQVADAVKKERSDILRELEQRSTHESPRWSERVFGIDEIKAYFKYRARVAESPT